jgi:RNA polymerase nonessential primary-like sigma factor
MDPSVPGREFEDSFDRAAGKDRALRRRVPAADHSAADGEEVHRRIRRLENVEPASGELTRLAERAAVGDVAARGRLVQRSLPLVMRVARRYAGQDVELADLVQEGVLGVLRALERFDPSRGVPFGAYATWWLRQSMQQAIAEQSRSIRLPTHVLWDIHRMRQARGEILADSGRAASAAELERRLEWSRGRVDDVLRAERPALSLDAPYAGDEAEIDSLGDLMADPLSEETYEQVVTSVSADAVRTLLSTLTERDQQVLSWRFGVEGEELSLRQIARRLGMSAERVRQIEQRALVKLRTAAVPANTRA